MAFLDNSGDIILDAVLTDVGRKRMADGSFRITQFALGDDEIDYGLYNKNHPSGSAYYDLQILQTPVLEAFTKSNANINYGLVSFNGNLNLLYLPTAKILTKSTSGAGITQQLMTSSVFYVAVNNDTATAIEPTLTSQYYQKGATLSTAVYIETGLSSSTENPPRTEDLSNRNRYLVSNDLIDSNFDVSVDSRFVNGVIGLNPPGSKWTGDFIGSSGPTLELNLSSGPTIPTGNRIGINHYKTAVVSSVTNTIKSDSSATWKTISEINGPAAVITAFAIHPQPSLGSAATLYSLHGKTAQNLFGDGSTYDYIDTIVYVVGKTTGVTIQIPYRIIRKR
jgi:hypothetical protein